MPGKKHSPHPEKIRLISASPTIPGRGQTDRDVLEARARAWAGRPVLRAVYADYFRKMIDALATRHTDPARPHGLVLELGGGAGHFRSSYPAAIVTDLVPNTHIDMAIDAMRLPLPDACIDNIVLHDVLHHLPFPLVFLAEASRVLTPGGRIVMIEPYISAVSGICYRLAHPEPVDMHAPLFPAADDATAPHPVAVLGQGAFASNQAIPTLLFFKYAADFARRCPELSLIRRSVHSMILYPLSGGFSKPVLLPQFALPAARKMEDWMSPLAPWLGFRMLVVLEKRA